MILPKAYSPVAYLCAEFAIDSGLPTYAGGLGILAGDYMNAAASEHFEAVGIGILYKGKHFVQHIAPGPVEEKRDSEFDHDTSFLRPTTIRGQALEIMLPTPEGEVRAKAYHIRLSDEAVLFFLSTDVDGNPHQWRADMDTLYSGDENSQIRQAILLGVGGALLLAKLGIKPKLYHLNEGRPGFLIWELAREIKNKKDCSFLEAWSMAKEKIVYTNHTLVAAGNPSYHIDAVKWWAGPFSAAMGVEDPYELVRDGHEGEYFSITKFALNISRKQSAVSAVHAKYSKKAHPEHKWVSVTNGVHLPRWQDSDFRDRSMTDDALWALHMEKKRELAGTVKKRTGIDYDPASLVITWARRLADYKQPKTIFTDLARLQALITRAGQPVQILYAGNSHAADPGSKELIEEVINVFSGELSGHAIFVPNYNIALANHLVSGSDVWLNTPKGNLEACGTSGMKAASNGVLNCTVLDGWTYEVDWDGVGWVLDAKKTAESFYGVLENDILPMYFDRNDDNLPAGWLAMMRASIALAERFSATRMLEEYKKKLYLLK